MLPSAFRLRKHLFRSMFMLLALVSVFLTQAQFNYAGYRSSNYTGVNGVFFNPANIADNRFRWDLNLSGLHAAASNNNTAYHIHDVQQAIHNQSDTLLHSLAPKSLSALAFADVLGPSLMISINPKTSIAVTTRARAMVNVSDLDGKLIQTIARPDVNGSFPYTIASNKNQRVAINAWTEYGISLGRVLFNEGNHFFKGGISIKYLSGLGNNYVDVNKIGATVDYDAQGRFYMTAKGTVALGVGGLDFSSINNSNFHSFSGHGLGADIGAVYEYRPEDEANRERWQNKYRYKIGLSILDIGSLKYSSNSNYTGAYTLVANGLTPNDLLYLNQLQGKSIPQLKTFMDTSRFFAKTGPGAMGGGTYAVALPTTLQLNADMALTGKFYAELAVQIALTGSSKYQNPGYQHAVTITPRYDGKAWGVFLPLHYSSLSGFNAGFALRAGPLYIGSGSVLTALSGATKQLDAFIGLHFGILYKKERERKQKVTNSQPAAAISEKTDLPKKPIFIDTDGDGITDSLDKCPTQKGLAKYNGCPIPDTDGDGINDEEDKCPLVAGVVKYNGCPVPDTDGDGINDEEDKCPNVAGPVSNKGCPLPDTDGDGVNDQEDRCPTLAGPPSNNGCPVVQQEMVRKINYAAKSILFNTGKASLLKSSFVPLNNIAQLLQKDTTLTLSIEGHTDNKGNPFTNKSLSLKRAETVKNYLIKKGIQPKRLLAVGFGDTQPIAENKTTAGRNKNRRVALKLKYE